MAVPQFEFDRDDAEQLLSNDQLGSAALNVTPAGVSFKPGFSIRGADVSFAATSNLSVQAYNSLDDVDADGVLLPKAKDKPPRMVALTTDSAWMKYRLDASLKATVKASLGAAGFSVDASAGAVLADYRIHERKETVRDAFIEDVETGVRSVFDLSSIERLGPGDAVTLQTQGAIEAKVTVSFSDLFTTQATALWSLAGIQKTVGFKVTAGATASFNVRVSDEFVVSFAGVDAKTWRIGVRKASSRKIGAGVAAQIEVEAADPKELAAFLEDVKDALIGAPLEKVKTILAKGSLENLTDAELAIVRKLFDRFGLSSVLETFEQLQAKIDAIDERIDDAIDEIAKAKIKIGFAYEYSRIVEEQQLLQMTVDRAHLRKLHGDVIRGTLGGAIDAIENKEAGVALEDYLNQKTLARTRSWGFTLGIGKWVDASGEDTDKLTVVTRRNLEGRVQESYLGTRGYEAKWMGDTTNWFADFRAEMRGYSQNAIPALPEFDLGLHLALDASEKKIAADAIDDYLDFAACWGIVSDAELASRREELLAAKGTGQDIAIQMTIGDEAFRLLLPIIAAATDASFAGPLAIAMPRQPKQFGLRTPLERLTIYRRVWESYLTHPDAGIDQRRSAAAAILKDEGQPALSDAERNAPQPHPLLDFTMMGRIASDGDPLERFRSFRNGAALLHQALTSGAPAETPLDRGRRSLEQCWTQVHHLRAIGAFLVDQARAAGVLGKIGRSFTMTPQKTGGGAKTFVGIA